MQVFLDGMTIQSVDARPAAATGEALAKMHGATTIDAIVTASAAAGGGAV